MIVTHLLEAAASAVTANPTRPGTALLHDSDALRLVLFRIGPGQAVPPHTSHSAVALQVVAGAGLVSGADGEWAVSAGDLVVFDEQEPHGMRATDVELVLLAAIAPRPGMH